LKDLVDAVGGLLFRPSGPVDAVFDRINLESSASYLLAFDVEPGDRAKRSLPILISTTRPGITLRTRPRFALDRANAPAARGGEAKRVEPPTAASRRLLDDLKSYPDVPLRATAYTTRARHDDQVEVVVVAETPADLAAVSFGLFDDRGRGTALWTMPPDVPLTSPVVARVPVRPAAYRLRAAGIDRDGLTGAADFEFTARLTAAGRLRLSDLFVGVATGTTFTHRLQFSTEPEAALQIELYGTLSGAARLSARLEIARDPRAVALVSADADVKAVDSTTRTALGRVAIAPLAPGDYVARAIVSIDGRAAGTVTRTLRKVALR
jgi:hypothetical protein